MTDQGSAHERPCEPKQLPLILRTLDSQQRDSKDAVPTCGLKSERKTSEAAQDVDTSADKLKVQAQSYMSSRKNLVLQAAL